MRVLVVDDAPDNVELLCQILEGKYELIRAYGGAEAISLALTEKPHIIILDVKMPGMDGYQVLEKLKAEEGTRDIPVIFLTASYKDPDRVAGGLDLGAVDYITKPIEGEILLARVSVAARIKRAEDAVRASNAELERRVEERTRQLSEANTELHEEIRTRKRVEEELKGKEKKVQEQATRLKTYVYTVGHFLKVPLTKIQGFSRVLCAEAERLIEKGVVGVGHTRKLMEFANIIRDEVKDAVDLDLYFLEYANIAVLEPAYEKLLLTGVIDRVIDEVRTKFAGRSPSVTVQGSAEEIPHNREHLYKALYLLFTYMISRTPKPVSPDIRVNIDVAGEFVKCVVESPIVVEKDISTLFDFLPEMRVGGRGIGTELALVKSYIELYGGDISFVTESGSGRFCMILKK